VSPCLCGVIFVFTYVYTYTHSGYYVNDYLRLFPSHPAPPTERDLSSGSLAREQVDFPRKGPVLVNLNNLYKVSPQVFALWVRVLRRLSQVLCCWVV